MAGEIGQRRMRSMRSIDRPLRRARLLAAKGYAPTSIPRHAILNGYWDHGVVVRRHLESSHGNES
jgi:hypothetical protein